MWFKSLLMKALALRSWPASLLCILRLREFVYTDQSKRAVFDKTYDYVSSALSSSRSSCEALGKLWKDHAQKVEKGEVAKLLGRDIHIEENIDKELRSEIETSLNAATRCLKTGMQTIASELGVDIGFLFQKPGAFEKGVSTLQKTDPELAEYLRQVRVWSEPMLKSRSDLEHGTWVLPRTTYSVDGNGIRAGEPCVAGRPVSEFVEFIFDKLCCFVEEFTAHCLRRRMPAGITLTESRSHSVVRKRPNAFRLRWLMEVYLCGELHLTNPNSRKRETWMPAEFASRLPPHMRSPGNCRRASPSL